MFEHRPKHLQGATDAWSDIDISVLERAISEYATDVKDCIPEAAKGIAKVEEVDPEAPRVQVFTDTFTKDTLDERLKSSLQAMLVTDTGLARDLAIFGDTHLDAILTAYKLPKEALVAKMEEKRFVDMVQQYRREVEKDSKGLLRARAAMYLEAQLDHAYQISIDSMAKDADRLNAVKFMATVADALPRNLGADGFGAGGAALNVTFNFGSQNAHNEQLKAIVMNGVTDV